MDAHVGRSGLAGTVRAPPSKSYTHRAILAAGYGDGTVIRNPLDGADPRATGRAVTAFGGSVSWRENAVHVEGFDGRPATPADVIDCGNSGTTTRIAAACGALAPGLAVLTGDGSLRSRPHGPLLTAVRSLGGRGESTRANGQAPLVVGGSTPGGRVSIPGDVSSQFVTALLLAGAVTDAGIEIELETTLKSAPYVEITRELQESFGVETHRTDDGFRVPGGQQYRREEYAVPGDFSSASYLLAAGAVAGEPGERLTVEGMEPSAQGDRAIVDVLDRMGASIEWDRSAGELHVSRSSLSGIEVSVADTPDLLPTIAVLGALADGDTRITDAEHVRYKETDRVAAMATALDRLGASVTERQTTLTVHGDDSTLEAATVDGRGDHRLVMALTVAGLAAEGRTTVQGAHHVDVSFPGFFETIRSLGADVATE